MTGSSDTPLRLLFWETTSRCNLACMHCRRQDVAEAAAADDLTADEARAMLDSAAALGQPVVVFSGGEPLQRDDLWDTAGYARELGLPTALATNGTLIDAATADRIAGAGFRRVAVSLDGGDAATHDTFRGVSGAFERALAGCREITAVGTNLQINASISGHNADQLDALYELAGTLDAVALHLFLLVPVGCGLQIAPTHQLTPQRYEQVLNWVCDRQQQTPLELRATCAPHYYRIAAQRGIDIGRGTGCVCGRSVVFVSHRGQVFPCGYLPVECGSVRQSPLETIWRNSGVLAALRDTSRLTGACGRCEYKNVCGGCRARAYAATGDYLAAEPACAYRT